MGTYILEKRLNETTQSSENLLNIQEKYDTCYDTVNTNFTTSTLGYDECLYN